MRRFIVLIFSLLYFYAFTQEIDTVALDDILSGRFMPRYVWGLNSMNDGEHYSSIAITSKGLALVKYSYKTGEAVDTLIKFYEFGYPWVSTNYQFSKDESKLLFYKRVKKIYRHSFLAEYFVYDFKTGQLTALDDKPQQIASLSPDGKMVAFMQDNNLFIKFLDDGTKRQITFDGEKNKIINGAPDWVYEEEFSFNKAYSWSPDGRYIAYLKFNESDVKTYSLIFYPDDFRQPYPKIYTYKYPKAGEQNSIVTVHIYDLKTGNTVEVKIPVKYEYIPRIKWRPDGKYLAIEVMNRHQDTLHLLYADPKTGNAFIALTETNSKYISDNFYDELRFLPDGYLLILSERDGWFHYYLYDWDGKFIKKLTDGNFDVIKFVDYNPKTKTLYYEAAKFSPVDRQIFALNIKTGKEELITPKTGYNSVEFSKTFKYYLFEHSSITEPPRFEIRSINGKTIRTIIDNSWLLDTLAKFGGINKQIFTFKTSEGVKLYAYRLVPPNFDSTKIYPAIVMQYSGPNSQTVRNMWRIWYEYYLASQGFVVFGVDTRGTGARGEQFRKITYLQLGNYEAKDLMETAKYIGSLPYIDKNRIGIWGWSYGGFMVLSVMTRYPGYYNTGVAIAPVTSWRYYDNIYTERYMRTPQENPDGYDNNSPITYAQNLKGHLLIVHGLADDNVHPENTFQFVTKLNQANIPYRMHIYPNQNHSLPDVYPHLFRMKTEFFKKYLLR